MGGEMVSCSWQLMENLELDGDGRRQAELLLPLHEDRHRVWGRWVVRGRWTCALGFDVLSRFEVMSLPLYWNKPHQLFLTLTATSLF